MDLIWCIVSLDNQIYVTIFLRVIRFNIQSNLFFHLDLINNITVSWINFFNFNYLDYELIQIVFFHLHRWCIKRLISDVKRIIIPPQKLSYQLSYLHGLTDPPLVLFKYKILYLLHPSQNSESENIKLF